MFAIRSARSLPAREMQVCRGKPFFWSHRPHSLSRLSIFQEIDGARRAQAWRGMTAVLRVSGSMFGRQADCGDGRALAFTCAFGCVGRNESKSLPRQTVILSAWSAQGWLSFKSRPFEFGHLSAFSVQRGSSADLVRRVASIVKFQRGCVGILRKIH